jgi:26S proteasome regulatory subunit N6
LQAEIDLQSGVLNAEERDFKTAYSYFFEAFEQYNNLKNPEALRTLKYLLLCKVMSDSSSEVPGIIASKSGLNYSGPELDAMRLIAEARTQSSLTMLQVFAHCPSHFVVCGSLTDFSHVQIVYCV